MIPHSAITDKKDVHPKNEVLSDSTETRFENTILCDLIPSLNNNRSLGANVDRRSFLKNPDDPSEKSQLHSAKKRQLFAEEENKNPVPLKKLKSTNVDDSINFDVSPKVSSSIDTQNVTKSVDSLSCLTSTVVETTILKFFSEDEMTSKNSTQRTSISKTSSCPAEKTACIMKARIKRRRPLSIKSLDGIDLTPKGTRVISETLQIKKELTKFKQKLNRKVTRNALKTKCLMLYKNFKNLSSNQQTIVKEQLRNAFKNANERRFSEEEKTLALAIYKHSTSAYRFLIQVLILPSINYINRNLIKIKFDTGINSDILRLLQECASSMKSEKDKTIILMWSETHLKNEVHYDYNTDKVIGFEDFGNRRTSKFASKILVFMIRGLWSNTKLPISYYFLNSHNGYGDLLYIISVNLEMLQEAGFNVVATVCDTGSSNLRVYEHLRGNYVIDCRKKKVEPDPNEQIIEFNGKKMCLIIDPLHIVKCIRNLMLKFIVEMSFNNVDKKNPVERKFVKWEHYETAFDMDVNSGIFERQIPKITEAHVRKNKIKGMKVLHCCQVFSRSMAKWLQTCVLIKDIKTTKGTFTMDKDALNTAEFTIFQDYLLDSLNARKSKKCANELRKPLQQVVTDSSPHWVFWEESIKILENMRFRTETKANLPKANKTLDRLITHLESMPDLWKLVKAWGFPYLKIGYLNQDPLENFFGRLKTRNTSPSPFKAQAQLKALMVSDLSGKNSIAANCLDDEETILRTLSTLATENSNSESGGNRSQELNEAFLPVKRKNIIRSPNTAGKRILSAGHFSKIVLAEIKGIRKCQICFDAFSSKKQNYNIKLVKSVGSTEEISDVDYFERRYSRGVKILEKKLASIGFEGHLRESLKKELDALDFEWIKCSDHRVLIKESFKENLVLHCINNWIVHLNQILIGTKKVIKGNSIETEANRQYCSTLRRVKDIL